MAPRRPTETVKAPELEPVPPGRGADEAPAADETDARLQETIITEGGLTEAQALGLIRLHARYRVPPGQYVAKLKKSWTDKQGREQSMTLDYVGHADATDILLREDPAWNWEPFAIHETGLPLMDWKGDSPVGMWIKLTIHGVTRIGYGTCPPKGLEGIKELIGDAIRNASMRFGLAVSLWSKSDMAQIQVDEDGEVSSPPIGSGGSVPPQRPTSPPQRQSAPPQEQARPAARPSGSVSRPADRQPPRDQPAPDRPVAAPPSRPEPRPEPPAEPEQERPLAPIAQGDDPATIPVDAPTATDLAVAMSGLTGPAASAFAKYRRTQNLPGLARDYTMQQAWDAMDFIDGLPQAD